MSKFWYTLTFRLGISGHSKFHVRDRVLCWCTPPPPQHTHIHRTSWLRRRKLSHNSCRVVAVFYLSYSTGLGVVAVLRLSIPCIVLWSSSIVPLSCRDWCILPLTTCRSCATTSLTYFAIDCILCCMATRLTYHPTDCVHMLCGNKTDLLSHWPCTGAVWEQDWPDIWVEGVSGTGSAIG